jgi:hypothetical protein
MRKQLASLTSIIFSPFVVGLVIILLVSLESTASVIDAIKWSLILIGLSILPIYLAVIYLVRSKKVDSIFINIRQQRHKIYALAVILGGAGSTTLFFLKAPVIILALFVSGFVGGVIFLTINLRWKISIHAAFVAALVTVMTILYGFVAIIAIVLLPLTAWARLELKHHSLAQLLTGILMAPLVIMAVFYSFGLI